MMNYDQYGTRVPGARREKLRGYLRAANELRQAYQDQLQQKLQAGEGVDVPGNFPDVEIVRSGEEEMLLFPSYARKHVKRQNSDAARDQPGAYGGVEAPISSGDAEYWRREWEKYEDANAVVDVDVRGWIYIPQHGPLNRKNRLLVAVARRLSGVPAPTASPYSSRSSSPQAVQRDRGDENAIRHEEMAAAQEAENIAKRGQKEAAAAERGSYSTGSSTSFQGPSPTSSRSSSPNGLRRTQTNQSDADFTDNEDFAIQKRRSWGSQAPMTREELVKANDMLMARLRPFMTLPLANTTITVFFFNDDKSSSKSVTTNESGHFNVRAALDFVPSQVRVLASENLSATEEVRIIASRGVSLISDIDDTIKHSAIASGAREIFRNTFVRELGELTIKGVKEWYGRLASMGVQLHYVSNSPWQLYPVLKRYFALAGLPSGSFHLKQYSGMLQGIFEPAAERKKGSLERILNDFPDRQFVLVGDSGEADLEVYTDIVLAYPKRILAVFIRDVTTPTRKGFFDQSMPMQNIRSDLGAAKEREDRPALPARPRSIADSPSQAPSEDLIDFSDDGDGSSLNAERTSSYADDLQQISSRGPGSHPSQPPNRPPKPSSLRTFSTQSPSYSNHDRISEADLQGQISNNGDARKSPPPPRPRRSSKTVNVPRPRDPMLRSQTSASLPPRNPAMTDHPRQRFYADRPEGNLRADNMMTSYHGREDEGYMAVAARRINSAYNAIPPIRSTSQERPMNGQQPPVPPRRGISSYPAAAARWATGATGGDPSTGGDGGIPGAPLNKKEEMWKRRWARAEDIMRRQHVVLRTWRVGSDVMDDCIQLVSKELKGMGLEHKDHRQSESSR